MDLAGTWRLALDPEDCGLAQKWFERELPGADSLSLPGSLQEAGFGKIPGPDTLWTGSIVDKTLFSDARYEPYLQTDNFKVPFWLQPARVYKGACWYQRVVSLQEDPDAWMELFLERCHWFSQVWIGNQELGKQNSLSTPHVYRFRPGLTGEQLLTIRIDNRLQIDVGRNSHSVSDHTQTNWNGIIGEMALRPVTELQLVQHEIHADPDTGDVRVDLKIHSDAIQDIPLTVQIRIFSDDQSKNPLETCTHLLTAPSDAWTLRADLKLPAGVEPWSPHHPRLYTMETLLVRGTDILLRQTDTFGFVHVAAQGQQILLNGKPLKLRGTLDCAAFPDHGYPPTDIDAWERIFGRVREYGLNHIRFHSWCPPEAAFIAGDRLGMILQVECASWAYTPVRLGNEAPIDAWLYEEGERIVHTYGNHPCFRLMAYGNEPAGPGESPGANYLKKWVTHWKQRDPRRLHTGGAGWPQLAEQDFHDVPQPRLQAWGAGLNGLLNANPPSTDFTFATILETMNDRPVISHEVGQWCVYPDMDEINDYRGFLKPRNLEIFRDFLDRKGLRPLAKDFHRASGHLQTLCYKAEIEAALRSSNLAGFQLLGLQDFPGQGTAPVGVLDAFWEPKDYAGAKDYREFCGDTVLLAAMDRMVFREGDTLSVELLCSHFGADDLVGGCVGWRLCGESNDEVARGHLDVTCIPTGTLSSLGRFEHRFETSGLPRKLELRLERPGTDIRNRWNLFVYPQETPKVDMTHVRVANEWSPDLESAFAQGVPVWLRLKPRNISTRIKTGYSSIFWNTPWTRGQAPHTLGILCDPAHPALAEFPTAFHSGAQWWHVLRNAAPMELDRLGWTDGDIISLVPDWNDPKPLSLAFEAMVGKSRVLVTSIDFDAIDDPSLRQLEISLMRYWTTNQHSPSRRISSGRLLTLLV